MKLAWTVTVETDGMLDLVDVDNDKLLGELEDVVVNRLPALPDGSTTGASGPSFEGNLSP